MPTVLRVNGLRVVIYLNDHSPAHVHVIGPGWVVVIDLTALTVREAIGCSAADARGTLGMVAAHRDTLMRDWRRLHG